MGIIWFALFVVALVLAVFQNRLSRPTVVLFWQMIGALALEALLVPLVSSLALLALVLAAVLFFYEKVVSPSRATLEILWKCGGSLLTAIGVLQLIVLMITPVTVQGVERNGWIVCDLTPHFFNGLGQMFSVMIGIGIGVASVCRGCHLQAPPVANAGTATN